MNRDCYPLVLCLPSGQRAEYVAGARPPRYTIAGQPSDIDVTIPDDLAQAGWYWSGSFLYQPWPERADGPGVAISTGTFGMPGTFEAARRLDAKRIEVQAMLAARPKKKSKAKKAEPAPVAPVAVAEPEQMELAL